MTRLLIILGLLASCDKAAPPAPVPGPPRVPEVAPAPTPTPTPTTDAPTGCAALSRAACLDSEGCTLHPWSGTTYECRDDQGPCEVGIKQQDRKACAANQACEWVPGECYCPCEGSYRTRHVTEDSQGCACACGGGPPSLCRERATK